MTANSLKTGFETNFERSGTVKFQLYEINMSDKQADLTQMSDNYKTL